jgi:hypothetical protein
MSQLGESLRSRYEELRAYAEGRRSSTSQPEGLALVMGRGVPDWMNTWSHVLPAEKARSPKANAETALPSEGLRSQLTVMLARMAMTLAKEPLSC